MHGMNLQDMKNAGRENDGQGAKLQEKNIQFNRDNITVHAVASSSSSSCPMVQEP